MRERERNAYHAWLWGEVLLFALLGAALALFVASPNIPAAYELPELKLVVDTAVVLAGGIVSVLAAVRFSVDGRRFDLLLSAGFFAASVGVAAFSLLPVIVGAEGGRAEGWSGVAAQLLAWTLIAVAPFASGRLPTSRRTLGNVVAGVLLVLALVWLAARSVGGSLPSLASRDDSVLLVVSLAFHAFLNLFALVGFGLRFRAREDDLDRWLALGASLMLFASLNYVFAAHVSSTEVAHGDFLRLLSYGVLLVGVWRAIQSAAFGRAVAEERARVAREIHDGLAQYLFAVSTHTSMLEAGASPATTIPRLKEAAAAAQQEARFAVLALSSAGGSAPFDAVLRRYVEFLTADGELAVDVEIDPALHLAPDEQIEVFRIVQEGLGNVRKHARATRADVKIEERLGRRVVTITDDGDGFDGQPTAAGQGLRNIRERAASIEGSAVIRSTPGDGTALEVTLRA